jgi:hypothetical protein
MYSGKGKKGVYPHKSLWLSQQEEMAIMAELDDIFDHPFSSKNLQVTEESSLTD